MTTFFSSSCYGERVRVRQPDVCRRLPIPRHSSVVAEFCVVMAGGSNLVAGRTSDLLAVCGELLGIPPCVCRRCVSCVLSWRRSEQRLGSGWPPSTPRRRTTGPPRCSSSLSTCLFPSFSVNHSDFLTHTRFLLCLSLALPCTHSPTFCSSLSHAPTHPLFVSNSLSLCYSLTLSPFHSLCPTPPRRQGRSAEVSTPSTTSRLCTDCSQLPRLHSVWTPTHSVRTPTLAS